MYLGLSWPSSNLTGINPFVLFRLASLAGCGVKEFCKTYPGVPLGGNPMAGSLRTLVVERE